MRVWPYFSFATPRKISVWRNSLSTSYGVDGQVDNANWRWPGHLTLSNRRSFGFDIDKIWYQYQGRRDG